MLNPDNTAAGTDNTAVNLALVQRTYAAFSAGDIAAILANGTPDIVWISGGSRDDFPTLGHWDGLEGAAGFFAAVAKHDTFTSFDVKSIHAADGMVFALGHYGITATATGKHFESDFVHVFTIANAKVARFQEFTDTAAFLKAGRS